MNLSFWLPLFIPLTSLFAAVPIFFLSESSRRLRTSLNIISAALKIALVVFLTVNVYAGEVYLFRFPLFLNYDIHLQVDPLSLMFVNLSAFLWLLTTIYAVGYLEGTPDQSRFFGFFSLCVAATTAIALAGNLFTLLMFYELLTLTTYPLVVHAGTRKALAAGRTYLMYTMLGGALLLLGMVWLSTLSGPTVFAEKGIISALDPVYRPQLFAIFALLVIGFGVKAAIVPLHGWLPAAMVAPAPVSALLHAVAVVKAGAFGIVRVIDGIYGVAFCQEFHLTDGLLWMACITILYGSYQALRQDNLKYRLAYSTVSQLSYIVLGVALLNPEATIGGIVHLVHQGIMKITLFFCAGNFVVGLHVKEVSAMGGIGRKMPLTMGAFTVAALGMIGIPPTAGFITKWYLGWGALAAGRPEILGVILLSSVLNAAYFLPIIYSAWFKPSPVGSSKSAPPWKEVGYSLLVPPLTTAALTILMGVFAGLQYSPLSWTKFIVSRIF